MSSNKLLSKKQFLESHGKAYRKLSPQEKSKRYNDYVRSAKARGRRKALKSPPRQMDTRPTPGLMSTGSIQDDVQVQSGGLSSCSLDYLHALTDPWNLLTPPCIPDFVVLPSFKFNSRSRGVLSTGTQGTGWIAVDPWAAAFSDAQLAVAATSATYSAVNYNPSAPGVVMQQIQSPLSYNPNEQRSMRVVGCSIKIRYSASEFKRGGRIISYRSPLNTGILATNDGEFLTNPESVSVPVDREWHAVCYRPAREQDLAYIDQNAAVNPNEYTLLLYITGAEAGVTFEFDVIGWFEMIGNRVAQATRSHSDPSGLAAVATALSQFQPTTSPAKNFANAVNEVGEIVSDALSFTSKYVVPAAKVVSMLTG